jgi:dynactin complex subunit
MIESHNGHEVDTLATVYNRIRRELQEEKREIETKLLPKYEGLLTEKIAEEAEISKRTDEVQRQIEEHTKRLINNLTEIKESRVQVLRESEKSTMESIANSKAEIERRLHKLKEMKTQISNNLGARPGIIFFEATNCKSLNEIRRYPTSTKFKLDNFVPGEIEGQKRDADFGSFPRFRQLQELPFLKYYKRVQSTK